METGYNEKRLYGWQMAALFVIKFFQTAKFICLFSGSSYPQALLFDLSICYIINHMIITIKKITKKTALLIVLIGGILSVFVTRLFFGTGASLPSSADNGNLSPLVDSAKADVPPVGPSCGGGSGGGT